MILNKEEIELAKDVANVYIHELVKFQKRTEETADYYDRTYRHICLVFLNLLNQKDILKSSKYITNIDEFSDKIDLLTNHLRHRYTKPNKLINLFDDLYNNDFYINDENRIKALKDIFEKEGYNPKNIKQNIDIINYLWLASIGKPEFVNDHYFKKFFFETFDKMSLPEYKKIYFLFNSASFETYTFFKQNDNLIKIDSLPKGLSDKEKSSLKYTFLFVVGRHLTKIDRSDIKILNVENMENLLFFLKKGNCPNLNNISKELKTRIEINNIYFDINQDFDKIKMIVDGIGFLIQPMGKRSMIEQDEYLDKEFSNYENLVEKYKEKDFSFDR